jgi:DNA invertase Pin-like site-specific DNA recombinase
MGSHDSPKGKVQVNLWLTWTFLVVLASAKTNTQTPRGTPSVRQTAKPTRRKQRIRRSTQDAAVQLYIQGRSARDIATELHIGRTTVLDILRRNEVEMRPPHRRY